jgi:hypothetical protein
MSRDSTTYTILYSGLIVAFVGLAGYQSYGYFSKSNLENVKIIQPQAEVIDNYSGSAPADQLNRLIDRIEIVKADNPSYTSEITALEDTVKTAQVAIGDTTDPAVYSPIMDKVAKSANDFADGHSRSGWALVATALWLGNTGYNIRALVKLRRSVREREEREAHNARRHMEAENREINALGADALRRTLMRTQREDAEPRIERNTEAGFDDNDIWKNHDGHENDGNQL